MLPTLRQSYTKSQLETFAEHQCSARVQALLNEPNGKENINQSFRTEATFRHCLLPLLKSGFLDDDSWARVACVNKASSQFRGLVEEFADVDFNDLRGSPEDSEKMTEVDPHRVKMASAAPQGFGTSSPFM